tara:strand:- start:952 stop:1308 length:357 start_codon:yes stop_codon:yes gene_type:complete
VDHRGDVTPVLPGSFSSLVLFRRGIAAGTCVFRHPTENTKGFHHACSDTMLALLRCYGDWSDEFGCSDDAVIVDGDSMTKLESLRRYVHSIWTRLPNIVHAFIVGGKDLCKSLEVIAI